MNEQQKEKNTQKNIKVAVFGSIRIMAVSALLAAASIVLGKYLAINPTSFIRISFENLPILMAGIFFGPLAGGIVGAVADIIGCFLVGYSINPVITLGAVLVGVTSGLISMLMFRRHREWRATPRIFIPVMSAHIIGSMIVKSIGMAIFFNTPVETLLWRVPLYIVVGALEGYIIMLLLKNKSFVGMIDRIANRK